MPQTPSKPSKKTASPAPSNTNATPAAAPSKTTSTPAKPPTKTAKKTASSAPNKTHSTPAKAPAAPNKTTSTPAKPAQKVPAKTTKTPKPHAEPSTPRASVAPALTREDAAKLATSGIDAVTARLMGVRSVSAEQAAQRGHPGHRGFVIPYHDPYTGEQTGFYRLRYTDDNRTSFQKLAAAKPMRYVQPADTTSQVYFAPVIEWPELLADPNTPLIITEGELKSACACLFGLPTLGLGGVWSFKSAKSGVHLLDELTAIEWSGRVVYVCYDSDAASNLNVVGAEAALAHALTGCGAQVFIARLAPLNDGSKCGMDDWLMEQDPAQATDLFRAHVLAHAYPYAESAALHDLNTQVVYVANPGFVYDRGRRLRMRPSDFTGHAYANRHYYAQVANKDGSQSLKKVPAANAWLTWPHRAELESVDFAPGEPEVTAAGRLNTWTGWGYALPEPGDATPWTRLLDHLFGTSTTERVWFERWCAYPLQHPGAKMATTALIWGITHGSGKTLVGHTLMRIYGKVHSAEIHDNDLEDERNEWAADKQFVLADDIVAKGDRKLMRHIMTMITQETIRINPKYVPSYATRDCANYYFTANQPDTFYMDDGDRRFFIFESMAGKITWYKDYVAWRDSPAGICALWHHLLNLDMGDFDPQAPAPQTDAKREMLETGKSDLGAWVSEFKHNMDYVLASAGMKGDIFGIRELLLLFDPSGTRQVTANALARELRRAGFILPGRGHQIVDAAGVQVRVYALRNLQRWGLDATNGDITQHYRQNHPAVKGVHGPKF